MASSNQCGNCGRVGHHRATCPSPKHETLEHWHAAKAQFRRENEEERRKLQERKEENRKWKEQGKHIPFIVLKEAAADMLQNLYDMEAELDVLGRPSEWVGVNERLDSILPLIREIVNNGKGFIFNGGLQRVTDGDIFSSNLETLEERRDNLVRHVKSFVNGKLGKLARVHARKNPEELLRYVYEHHPPNRAIDFDGKITGTTLRAYLRKSMLYYHPDKQVGLDREWQCLCEAISRCLSDALTKLK